MLRWNFERMTRGRVPAAWSAQCLTYGQRAKDRPELFERGALTWPADGVVLESAARTRRADHARHSRSYAAMRS